MTCRIIRLFGDEILRKKSTPVDIVDDEIRQTLNDMAETIHKTKNAAALAAPQIGILKQLIVIDLGKGPLKLVNPKIIRQEGQQEVVEGCLSIPDTWGKLIRPAKVTVRALNENGKEITLKEKGSMAKCLCHEIDHLDGILFTDLVTEYVE